MKRTRRLNVKNGRNDILHNKSYLSFGEICLAASLSSSTHNKYVSEALTLLSDVSEEVKLEILIILTKKHIEIGVDMPQVICFMDFIALYLSNVEKQHQEMYKATHSDDCEMHFLIRGLLKFLMDISCADHVDTRKLSLHFINILLGKLGNRSIDDDIFDELTKVVLERIQDVNNKVRAEAIYTGRRLQNPRSESDLICKTYKFHMKNDPSVTVRKAGVDCIGYSTSTREAIIARITDVDEGIRLLAFERIYEMPLKSLKLGQRHKLLHIGLKDKSSKVKIYIRDTLLPHWLEQSDKSLISLIDNIRYDTTNSSKIENDMVLEKVLNIFFKRIPLKRLIAELNLNENKLIPVKKLSAHFIIYWHRLAAFLKKNDHDIDCVLPMLLNLVSLIEDFDNFWKSTMAISNPTNDQKLDQLDYNIGKLELLRIVQLHDYVDDEVGRIRLNKYIFDDALRQKYMVEEHYFIILKILHKSCLKFMTWQTELLNVINEIYEPTTASDAPEKVPPISLELSHTFDVKRANLKIEIIDLETQREEALCNKDYNKAQDCDDKLSALQAELKELDSAMSMVSPLEDDVHESERIITDNPEDIIKVLIIFYGMLSLFDHKLTPEMLIILEDVVHPNLFSDNSEIEYWALRCAGAFCLQSKQKAQIYFPMFFSKMFSVAPVIVPSLSGYIDPVSAAIRNTIDDPYLVSDVALQIVLDMFIAHPIESFEIQNSTEDTNSEDYSNLSVHQRRRLFPLEQNKKEEQNIADKTNFRAIVERTSLENNSVSTAFVKILMKLLHESQLHSTRLIVVQGLIKMFLLDKITSDKILAHLLLLYHHPEMDMFENNDIRQHIALLFMEMGNGKAGGAYALINAITPALTIWCDAPSSSVLKHIDCFDILKLIIMTSSNGIDGNHLHNDIALKLCDLMKRLRRNEELQVALSKALSICNICADGQLKLDLKSCVSQLMTIAKNKQSSKYLKQVLINIESGFVPEDIFEKTPPDNSDKED